MEICNFCNGKFTETGLTRHQGECKQIHSPASLTESQRDVFIRKLLLQVSKMSGKLTEMQTELSYLKRKQKSQTATLLNKNQSDVPPVHIMNWIKSVPVSQFHLDIVFRKTLVDGIKQVIIDGCTIAKTLGSNIPVRAFSGNPKCIFIFMQKEEKLKWVICDHGSFRKICAQIASRFIELFVLWQTTQLVVEQSSEEDRFSDTQEQNMHFMKKVMDNTYTQQGHICKMIEDVYISIHNNSEL